MKYKLITEESIQWQGRTLHRIQALRDFECQGMPVKAGDLGGWIESEDNLSQKETCWVSSLAWVFGSAKVHGLAWVCGSARVYGSAKVFDSACVFGSAQVSGLAWVYGSAQVYDSAWVYDSAKVFGSACVFGSARLRADKWTHSPLVIQGTRDVLCTVSHTEVAVGCETHPINHWLEHYETIGEKHRYTPQQIKEYHELLLTAKNWLSRNFPETSVEHSLGGEVTPKGAINELVKMVE